MNTRGPKAMPPASRSGSVLMAARISMRAVPMVTIAPGARSSRVSKAGSAAAPNVPSRSAKAAASGSGGSSATWPNSG